MDHQSQKAGLGVVIRNDKGDVVAAAIKPSSFNGDVPFAEAEAIEWGMQVAKRAGINAVILESDCQVAIDLTNNRKGSKAEIFWVVSEINERRKEFQEVRFQHTLRSCNANAHSLAKLAVKVQSQSPPPPPTPILVPTSPSAPAGGGAGSTVPTAGGGGGVRGGSGMGGAGFGFGYGFGSSGAAGRTGAGGGWGGGVGGGSGGGTGGGTDRRSPLLVRKSFPGTK
ncbi:probable H/ACA ribonucleoprotein complex subunit 1 [Citrus clementina]|uniref:probable H/ACA ribonucleoprotein complex subunit 1 n=1 Tax=Citrus clementina TaxID=85681 RepID=UPI000CED0C5F|nr:probable H/ACA ribonucleoprotein complex subunit 1 [Citrus x clementina]